MKQKGLMLVVLTLLSVPLARANIYTTIINVFDAIINGIPAALGIAADPVTNYLRLMVGFIAFVLFFVALLPIIGRIATDEHRGRVQVWAGSIAFALAAISYHRFPVAVLLAVGVGWATVVSFVIIGLPTLGFVYALLRFPKSEELEREEYRPIAFVKVLACFLMGWVLEGMNASVAAVHGSPASTPVTASINQFIEFAIAIVAILGAYYFIRFITGPGLTDAQRTARQERMDEFFQERKDARDKKRYKARVRRRRANYQPLVELLLRTRSGISSLYNHGVILQRRVGRGVVVRTGPRGVDVRVIPFNTGVTISDLQLLGRNLHNLAVLVERSRLRVETMAQQQSSHIPHRDFFHKIEGELQDVAVEIARVLGISATVEADDGTKTMATYPNPLFLDEVVTGMDGVRGKLNDRIAQLEGLIQRAELHEQEDYIGARLQRNYRPHRPYGTP